MAFSFTSAGFGGFGIKDPTDKTKKVLTGSTEKRVATKEGYDRIITSTYKTTTTTPGSGKLPYAGSESFQTAFASARKSGKSQFNFGGKPYSTDLYKPRPSATSVDFSTESRTAPGLRFTAGSPNITAKPLLTPKKMNGGENMKNTKPPKPSRKPIKIPTPNLQFIPDAFEAVGQAFSNLRLFRKGRGRGRGGRGCGFCGKKLLKTFKR